GNWLTSGQGNWFNRMKRTRLRNSINPAVNAAATCNSDLMEIHSLKRPFQTFHAGSSPNLSCGQRLAEDWVAMPPTSRQCPPHLQEEQSLPTGRAPRRLCDPHKRIAVSTNDPRGNDTLPNVRAGPNELGRRIRDRYIGSVLYPWQTPMESFLFRVAL